MTLSFDAAALESRISPQIALDAMREAFAAEARGATQLPHRIDIPTKVGFLRVMPAVLDDVMGLKVMTLVEGVGNRYLILLYDVNTGELLALFDADELTRVRTAATTALAASFMCQRPPSELSIIGTGFEAVGHLRCFAGVFPIKRVTAFSPSENRCLAFAATMSSELGIEVVAARTSTEAMGASSTVILATKAKQPVIDGAAFLPKAVVLSIGSTRLDLRELDNYTLERTSSLVVDDVGAVLHESGDIADSIAAGVFSEKRMIPMAQLSPGHTFPPAEPQRDLLVFKSVGTALQDLALARALYRDAEFRRRGVATGELTSLKPFAARVTANARA